MPFAEIAPIVGTAVSYVIGFLSAVCAEPLRQRLFAGKFSVTSGNNHEFNLLNPMEEDGVRYQSRWIRLKVTNVGWRTIRDVRAYLVKIEKKNAAGRFEPTCWADTLQLKWSSRESSDDQKSFSALDLTYGVVQYVDLIQTDSRDRLLHPCVRQLFIRYQDLFNQPGVYRYTIQVSGDGASHMSKQVVVNWNSAWDQILVEVE
jgi:hypothetical protein